MKKRSLLGTLLLIGLVPLLVASISLCIISANRQSSNLQESTFSRLEAASQGIASHYAKEIQTTGTATYDHEYVDSLKAQDIELTLFIGDTRYVTSIIDAETNERNEGTQAASEIYEIVSSGNDYSQKGVVIGGRPYYVYYTPIYSQNNSVVGMGFAGEPEENVTKAIRSTILGMVSISVLLVAAFTILVVLFAFKIRKPISIVSESMNILSKGDLSRKIVVKSVIKEIASLIEASNNLRDNLSNIISKINSNTNEMNQNMNEVAYGVENYTEVSGSVANAITELASGSIEMAESVENCTVSMQEMGDQITSIKDLANNANENADGVLSVCANAKTELVKLIEASTDTISISDDVVNGIKHASDAAEKIRIAADAITSIASETNLLSLNASIEAARAGEAGRGFSVVASNIQSLAQQSDASAKEIQSIIENIIQISETNVSLANSIKSAVDNEGAVLDEVSKTFDTVDDKVRDTAGAVSAIHDKVALLNSSKDSILEEITTLSAISEENAASCEETNASMEELRANMENISTRSSNTRDVSTNLSDIVSYFSLGD